MDILGLWQGGADKNYRFAEYSDGAVAPALMERFL
jgi:hypothetical protein